MKKILGVILVCAIRMVGFAQTNVEIIQLATDKTTSLIFPYPVIHVDRGSAAIMVQQIPQVPTILLVKAAAKDFTATNMTVATADGTVYAFSVQFLSDPQTWLYKVPPGLHAAVDTYARSIIANSRSMHGISDDSWDMVSKIIGIYIKDDVLYYQLLLDNRSTIGYDIDFIRFYIRDKRKGRRTATQERELKPLYLAGNTCAVAPRTTSVLVVALPKFTVPDSKYLAVEINERNGGRHLQMRVGNRKIVRAIALPDLL